MPLIKKRSNPILKSETNPSDWSAFLPILLGNRPNSRQIYTVIKKMIETGVVQQGAKLPTTRDLAGRFGLSRTAAVSAFEMLTSDGLVQAKVGAGTFVAPRSPYVPTIRIQRGAQVSYSSLPKPCALGVAVSDARTLQIFRKLVSRHLTKPGSEHFRYGDPRGGDVLRRAIACYLRAARGVRCNPDQIVVTSGTLQGLDLVIRAAILPGDAVWIEDPCYPMARTVLSSAGGNVVGIPVDTEGLDIAFGETIFPKARAVYITPSHQFPLGVTMTIRRRIALLDWAQRNNAWIIEDDYDSEFRYTGAPLTSLQGMDSAARVIYLGTFSKVLFPGLRVGYAVVPESLLDAILNLRSRSDRQPPTLAEGALADFLLNGHFAAHLRRNRRHVRSARDVLVSTLLASSKGELDVTLPEQGLHVVAKFLTECSDVEIVKAINASGVGARALSTMFSNRPSQAGLVLGFSGFGNVELQAAARTIISIVEKGCNIR